MSTILIKDSWRIGSYTDMIQIINPHLPAKVLTPSRDGEVLLVLVGSKVPQTLDRTDVMYGLIICFSS